MSIVKTHLLQIPEPFSLAQTTGPAYWMQHRSPKHAWLNGTFISVEARDGRVIWRKVRQTGRGALEIMSNTSADTHEDWAHRILCTGVTLPAFNDPVIQALADRYPGLHPLADGSLFDGLLTSIIGQSVSLASAAAAQHKLAVAFTTPVELGGRRFAPLPSAAQLADASVDLIRASGVTWRRAEAIRTAARTQLNGELPTDEDARQHPGKAMHSLLALPQVGPWTAESALLWGVGAPDAHPTGDVALLRAARKAYDRPEMTLKELDLLSGQWRPARALAARLLWADLFGIAPEEED